MDVNDRRLVTCIITALVAQWKSVSLVMKRSVVQIRAGASKKIYCFYKQYLLKC